MENLYDEIGEFMQKGRVINSNSGVYTVVLANKEEIKVKARGKLRNVRVTRPNDKSFSSKAVPTQVKISPKVGDIVYVEKDWIDHIEPRKNELIRPEIANVDQILLIFAATEPEFSFLLLDLFLVNILKEKINPIIVVTKIDKIAEEKLNELKEKLLYYENLGYKVLYIDGLNKKGIEAVCDVLNDKITVLSGQTGAGKSTLINAIIPNARLKTQEISNALGRGKHTTRQTSLYEYENGYIGDTPGFSKLDLFQISEEKLAELFIEFKQYSCRYKNCLHKEGSFGCGVISGVKEGKILSSRYENYLQMLRRMEGRGSKL